MLKFCEASVLIRTVQWERLLENIYVEKSRFVQDNVATFTLFIFASWVTLEVIEKKATFFTKP
jgi:hypothetical protein